MLKHSPREIIMFYDCAQKIFEKLKRKLYVKRTYVQTEAKKMHCVANMNVIHSSYLAFALHNTETFLGGFF